MQNSNMRIEELNNIGKETKDILKKENVEIVSDLCDCTRTELVDYGIYNTGINEIHVALQLLGLDIRPTYKSKK